MNQILTTKQRVPIRTTDERGRAIVRVPLTNHAGEAVVEESDFDRLTEAGLPMTWQLNGGNSGPGYVRAYCNGATGNLLTVARLITGAGYKQIVRYNDGDRTNLRRSNLKVVSGYGKRVDMTILAEIDPVRNAARLAGERAERAAIDGNVLEWVPPASAVAELATIKGEVAQQEAKNP